MPANYQELVQDVVELVGRQRIRPKVLGWIRMAEETAVQRIRELREVIYIFSGTMTENSDQLTLPAGITGIEGLQIDTDPIRIVKQIELSELQRRREILSAASDLYPLAFCWTGAEKIEMVPIPTGAHAYTLYYKGNLSEVTELKVTSQLLEQASNYLLYKAAQHAFLYTRNPVAAAEYKQEAEEALVGYSQLLARGDLATPQVAPINFIHDHPQMTGSSR